VREQVLFLDHDAVGARTVVLDTDPLGPALNARGKLRGAHKRECRRRGQLPSPCVSRLALGWAVTASTSSTTGPGAATTTTSENQGDGFPGECRKSVASGATDSLVRWSQLPFTSRPLLSFEEEDSLKA